MTAVGNKLIIENEGTHFVGVVSKGNYFEVGSKDNDGDIEFIIGLESIHFNQNDLKLLITFLQKQVV